MLIWNGIRRSIVGPAIAGASVVIGAFFMMVRLYVPAFNVPQEHLGEHTIADFYPAGNPAEWLLPGYARRVGRLHDPGGAGGSGPRISVGKQAVTIDVHLGDQGGADVCLVQAIYEGPVHGPGKPEYLAPGGIVQEGRDLNDREINRALLRDALRESSGLLGAGWLPWL